MHCIPVKSQRALAATLQYSLNEAIRTIFWLRNMSAHTALLFELLVLVFTGVHEPVRCAHWVGHSTAAHWATNQTWGTSGPLVLDPFLRAEFLAQSPSFEADTRLDAASDLDASTSGRMSPGGALVRVRRAPGGDNESGSESASDDARTLHIAGFLGRSRGALHAVRLALNAVNARPDILGPYRLAFLDTLTMVRPRHMTRT